MRLATNHPAGPTSRADEIDPQRAEEQAGRNVALKPDLDMAIGQRAEEFPAGLAPHVVVTR